MTPTLPDAITEVTPARLVAYLRTRGWQRTDAVEARWSAWSKRDTAAEQAIEVAVPLDPAFRDYARRVTEALQNLSIAEARPSELIFADIVSGDRDRVRLRIAGSQIKTGRVALAAGAAFTSAVQSLIATAARASDATGPKAVYGGRSSQRVDAFLQRVEVSAPGPGSFVLNVETPVPPEVQLSVRGEDEAPFERQVFVTLSKSLAAAEHSARDYQLNGNEQAFGGAVSSGVSANLCEALARILEETPADVFQADFSWSSNRSAPTDAQTRTRFPKDVAPVFRAAAAQIRSHAPEVDFEVVGFPVRLEARDGESASGGGAVVVIVLVEGRPKKVRIDLDPEDYPRAVQAHAEGQAIHVEGELMREGRQAVLTNYRHFEILSDLD